MPGGYRPAGSGGAWPPKPGDLSEESLLALGRCQMELGDPALADLAFVPLIDSSGPGAPSRGTLSATPARSG